MVVRVQFGVPAKVSVLPSGVHAVLSRWLDAPEQAHAHALESEPLEWWPLGRPSPELEKAVRPHETETKWWSIVGLETHEEGVTVDVGLMDADDASPGTLAHRLARFSARHLLRPSNAKLAHFAKEPFVTLPAVSDLGEPQPVDVIASVSWRQLVSAPPTLAWSWRFLSPTRFGQKLDPLYSPKKVLSDLQASWNTFAAQEFLDAPAAALQIAGSTIITTNADLHVVATGDRNTTGFTGSAAHRANAQRDFNIEDLSHALGTLLAFSAYRGIGATTTRGHGQVVVEQQSL